jgi:EAL domain
VRSSARITQELLQRLSAQRFKSHSDFSPLCIVASISNLRHIDSAYGASLAANVLQAVLGRARALCRAESGFAAASGSHILCVFECGPESDSTGHQPTDREDFLVDKIIDVLGGGVENDDGGIVYPAIIAAVVARTDVPLNIDEVFSRPECEGSPAWRSRYVADMKTAANLLAALNRNELCFRFEKVCTAQDSASFPYYEMLLCKIVDGVPVSAGEQIASLERVGLIGLLDKWVVASVIDMLRARSDICLGCNVSAQSATLDGWWRLAIEVLRQEPEVASRLVIEITESSIVTDMPRLSDLIKALQRLGCRVALDDIGKQTTL